MSADFERWVVILAGGIGSRFWPASTPGRPKQFLPLASERPLIVDTVERARALTSADKVLIVAGRSLKPHLERQLPDLPAEQLLLEPQARGTAAALAWAATEITRRATDPDRAVMISLHSDHVIRPLEGFTATLNRAIDAAGRTGRLLTVGIVPGRPETGYGYIEAGVSLSPGVLEVKRFIEKPDRETAQRFIDQGSFLWNSGMFIWRPAVLLSELTAHTPELAGDLSRLAADDVDGFFADVPTLTIDNGLMERSPNIAVVKSEFEWDDVGAWAALLRVRSVDDSGNLVVGEGQAVESRDSLIWGEDGPVVAFGLDGVLVVRASGITFVAPLDRTADLKQLLAQLPDRLQAGEG
jgi:mannose-1-phosphate guanylyltransferase